MSDKTRERVHPENLDYYDVLREGGLFESGAVTAMRGRQGDPVFVDEVVRAERLHREDLAEAATVPAPTEQTLSEQWAEYDEDRAIQSELEESFGRAGLSPPAARRAAQGRGGRLVAPSEPRPTAPTTKATKTLSEEGGAVGFPSPAILQEAIATATASATATAVAKLNAGRAKRRAAAR